MWLLGGTSLSHCKLWRCDGLQLNAQVPCAGDGSLSGDTWGSGHEFGFRHRFLGARQKQVCDLGMGGFMEKNLTGKTRAFTDLLIYLYILATGTHHCSIVSFLGRFVSRALAIILGVCSTATAIYHSRFCPLLFDYHYMIVCQLQLCLHNDLPTDYSICSPLFAPYRPTGRYLRNYLMCHRLYQLHWLVVLKDPISPKIWLTTVRFLIGHQAVQYQYKQWALCSSRREDVYLSWPDHWQYLPRLRIQGGGSHGRRDGASICCLLPSSN